MHKIDTASSVATMPTPSALNQPGWFSHGNPALGVPFTVLSSDWANSIQAEIINVISAASITLDKTVQNQLLAAINALIAPKAAPAALVSFGFGAGFTLQIPIQSGLNALIEAAAISVPSGAGSSVTTTFNFASAFPTACLATFICFRGTTPANGDTCAIQPISNTQFTATGNADGTNLGCMYIAIGF